MIIGGRINPLRMNWFIMCCFTTRFGRW